jgi:hypothetical protein
MNKISKSSIAAAGFLGAFVGAYGYFKYLNSHVLEFKHDLLMGKKLPGTVVVNTPHTNLPQYFDYE